MNKEWSLEKLYKGYDDPNFKADEEKLDSLLKEIAEFTADLSGNPKDVLVRAIRLNQEITALAEKLFLFAELQQAVNTSDTVSTAAAGRFERKLSALAVPRTALVKYIASLDDLSAYIEQDELLK
ncbi:MAG: hypothetical protein IKG55_00955, partial [Solobacterium sp.]|nr:hypothetical protein [Solobacterium sp.]